MGSEAHRYVLEWAEALEEMAAVELAAVVSGHGDVFTDDATDMLLTTSRALRWLDAEVVRRINAGQWQEQILAEVQLPDVLTGAPARVEAEQEHLVGMAIGSGGGQYALLLRRWLGDVDDLALVWLEFDQAPEAAGNRLELRRALHRGQVLA